MTGKRLTDVLYVVLYLCGYPHQYRSLPHENIRSDSAVYNAPRAVTEVQQLCKGAATVLLGQAVEIFQGRKGLPWLKHNGLTTVATANTYPARPLHPLRPPEEMNSAKHER